MVNQLENKMHKHSFGHFRWADRNLLGPKWKKGLNKHSL